MQLFYAVRQMMLSKMVRMARGAAMNAIEWAQRRLIAAGFDPGDVDGIWGRNTMNATVAFQKARGLPVSGHLNGVTMAALRAPTTVSASAIEEAPDRHLSDVMPWMAIAESKMGLHETLDNSDVKEFLKSDGATLGDPSKLPWCGDFVETCIALAVADAVLPVNPYLARNWLKFGRTVDPCYGAVLVFERGKPPSGHVGFYVSEDDTHFEVLGGNQSNRVSLARLDKARLLGARLPLTGGPYPRRVVTKDSVLAISENEF
jgi:uncharacterized protein (TIGR02594 family)